MLGSFWPMNRCFFILKWNRWCIWIDIQILVDVISIAIICFSVLLIDLLNSLGYFKGNSASRVSCAQSWPVDLSSVFLTLSCLSFTAGVFKVWVLAETLRVESLVLSHDRLIWAQCFWLCRVSRSPQVFSRSEFWLKLCESSLLCSVMTGWFELSVSDSVVSLVHRRCFQGLSSGRNSASRVSCAQSWPVDLSSVFLTLSCLSFTAGVFKVWVLAETLRVESLVLSHDRLIWAQCFWLCRVSRSLQVFLRSEFWPKLCESSLLCSVMTGWFELSVSDSDSVVSLVHRRCFQGLSSGRNSASRVSCAQSWPVDLSSVFLTLSCLSFTAGVFKVWVLAETLRVESLVLSHDRLIWAQCFRLWLCRVSRSLQVFSRSEFWLKLCESSLLCSVMTGWFELSVSDSDSVVSLVHRRCFQGLSSGWNSASRVSCAQSWPVDLSSVFLTLSCLSFTAGVFKVWVLAETLRVESLVLSHERLIWAQCFRLCRVSRSPQVFSRSEFWPKLCESSLLCSVMTGWFELSVSDSVVSLVHRRCF